MACGVDRVGCGMKEREKMRRYHESVCGGRKVCNIIAGELLDGLLWEDVLCKEVLCEDIL